MKIKSPIAKNSSVFIWFAAVAVVFILGCSSPPSTGMLSKQGSGLVANALSNELGRYGCQLNFDGTLLAGVQERWDIERDTDKSIVVIEGNHVAAILEAFKRKFGEPAFVSELDTDGHLSFAYRKDQCGVILNCGVRIPRPGDGYKTPLTSVHIFSKIAPF